MEKTIEQINKAVAARVIEEFGKTDVCVFGLAEPVLVRDHESDTTSPAIVCSDGECRVVYDALDSSIVTIYGRLQSISYERGTTSAYGNSQGYDQVADASLIAIGRRTINSYRMERVICDVLGSVKGCQLASADFNAVQVWASEFPGVPYFINPDYFLFKINYKLSTSTGIRCNKQ